MSWFKKRYSVCSECQVHFEPATGMDAERWPDLCPTHRKPVKERDLRKDSVLAWALQNWEKLEPQCKEECSKQNQAAQELFSQWQNWSLSSSWAQYKQRET